MCEQILGSWVKKSATDSLPDWLPSWSPSRNVLVLEIYTRAENAQVYFISKYPNRSCILTPKAPCLCKVLGRPFAFIGPFTAFKSHKLKNWMAGTQDTFSQRNIHKIVLIVDNKHIVVPSFSNEVKRFGCVCICSSLIRHLFLNGRCLFLPRWNYLSFHLVCVGTSIHNNHHWKKILQIHKTSSGKILVVYLKAKTWCNHWNHLPHTTSNNMKQSLMNLA